MQDCRFTVLRRGPVPTLGPFLSGAPASTGPPGSVPQDLSHCARQRWVILISTGPLERVLVKLSVEPTLACMDFLQVLLSWYWGERPFSWQRQGGLFVKLSTVWFYCLISVLTVALDEWGVLSRW